MIIKQFHLIKCKLWSCKQDRNSMQNLVQLVKSALQGIYNLLLICLETVMSLPLDKSIKNSVKCNVIM